MVRSTATSTAAPATGQFSVTQEEVDTHNQALKYTNPADIPISPGGEIEDEAIDRSHEPDKSRATSVK